MFTNFVATPNSLVTARWLVHQLHQQLLSTSMITLKWHFWVPKRSSFQRDVPLLRPLHRDWHPRRHLETVWLSHLSHHFSRIFCGIVQSCNIILSSRRGIKTYCNNRTRKYVCNTQRLYPLYLHGLNSFQGLVIVSVRLLSGPWQRASSWYLFHLIFWDWGGLQEKCDADSYYITSILFIYVDANWKSNNNNYIIQHYYYIM